MASAAGAGSVANAAALAADVDRIAAESGFAGVVRVDRAGTTELSAAYGLADRRHGVAMTPDSQLAIASGSKGMTALAVMSLVEEGSLSLARPGPCWARTCR